MDEDKWSPESAFKKVWSFVSYASSESAKTGDLIGKIFLVGFVWVVYLPIALVTFPIISFLWFHLKKALGSNRR